MCTIEIYYNHKDNPEVRKLNLNDAWDYAEELKRSMVNKGIDSVYIIGKDGTVLESFW